MRPEPGLLPPLRRALRMFAAAVAIAVGAPAALSADSSPPAASDWRAQVEADWLRQAARRSASAVTPAGVTAAEDAAGGCDGVKNGRWGFHTGQETNAWWQVDLGVSQALGQVLIYNRCDLPARAAALVLLLSDDGTTWKEAYRHDGTLFYGVSDRKPLAVGLKGAAARFVRVQLPGPEYLQLDEVEVYGVAEPAKNLALRQPADQSSVSQWSVRKALPIAQVQTAFATDAAREAWLEERWAARQRLFASAALDFDRLLFVRRITYCSSHIYTDHFDGSRRMGGNLCVLSPVAPDGQVTEMAPELNGGLFGRFDLSFDATRVVFAYKRPGKGYQGYRIYEIGVDGGGSRQLTHDGPDEAEMIRRFGHGYDDMDPCYLPDGRIMFTSTRQKRTVLCHNAFTSTALHVMDADGGNMRCLSSNTVNEFTPAVMVDGRVLYTRWEYVDKGSGDVQSLWSMHPDGSHSAHVYKNNVALPATLIDGRELPDSRRIIAIGAPHMPLAVGPVVRIDIGLSQRTSIAMTNLTPEIGYPSHSGYPSGRNGYYKEPYPLSDDVFLVSYNPGPRHDEPAGYGLYLLDASGQRELIYRDERMSCFQPMPLRPRRRPPVVPSVATGTGDAVLLLADVYEGMTGIERGRVKYLRVMEDVPKPWEPSWGSPGRGDTLGLQNPAVSLNGHFALKKVHGVVAVEADGSAYFTVPPERNLYFQALDEHHMELQRMRTFVNLMPGETRSCVGCHEGRNQTPAVRRPQAGAPPPRPPPGRRATSPPSPATPGPGWSTTPSTSSPPSTATASPATAPGTPRPVLTLLGK